MTDSPKPRRPHMARPDRRAEIAAAALTILKSHGYAALTARKVAEAAGLSLGHLTYSFRDMDELLSETYRLASSDLRAQTTAGLTDAGADPMARLKSYLRAGFGPDMLDPGHLRMRIDLWSAAQAHPKIAETERALYDRYRQELIGLMLDVAPDARQGALSAVADAIMAMLDGLWLDFLRRRDPQAVDNGLAACLDLVHQRFLSRR